MARTALARSVSELSVTNRELARAKIRSALELEQILAGMA